MTKRINCVVLVLSVFTMCAVASDAYLWWNTTNRNVGTTSANFLKIGAGARPLGLGGAYCSVAGDVYGMYYNSAGISGIKKHELSAMHNEWLDDVRHEYVGYAMRLNEKLVVGANATYLWMGRMDKVDELDDYSYQLTGTTFTAYDVAIGIACSYSILDNLSAGVNLKGVYQSIDVYKSWGGVADFGLLYEVEKDRLNIGLACQNVGYMKPFIERTYVPPTNFKLGVSYRIGESFLFEKDYMVTVDLNQPIDNYFNVSVGAEFTVMRILSLRVGYNSLNDVDRGLSAGVGLKIENFNIDYAWVPYGSIDNTHRISATIKFGEK